MRLTFETSKGDVWGDWLLQGINTRPDCRQPETTIEKVHKVDKWFIDEAVSGAKRPPAEMVLET